jgi:hypothetical protein
LNPRPHGPEPCALAGLRYAPNEPIIPYGSMKPYLYFLLMIEYEN